MATVAALLVWLPAVAATYSLEWQLAAAPACAGQDLCQFFVRRDSSDEVVVAASVVAMVAPGPLFVNASTSSAPLAPTCSSYVSLGQVVWSSPDCTSVTPSFLLNASTFRGGWYCASGPSGRPTDLRLFLAQLSVPAGSLADLTLAVVHGDGSESVLRTACNPLPATSTTMTMTGNTTTAPDDSERALVIGVTVGVFALLLTAGIGTWLLVAFCQKKRATNKIQEEPWTPSKASLVSLGPGSPMDGNDDISDLL